MIEEYEDDHESEEEEVEEEEESSRQNYRGKGNVPIVKTGTEKLQDKMINKKDYSLTTKKNK